MEFWGLEVPATQTVDVPYSPDSYIHVSNVALGDTKNCGDGERVLVKVKHKGRETVLGTLTPKICDQFELDLIFGEPFYLSHTSKNCSVYFSGYTTDAPPMSDMDDDDESEEEEENHVPKLRAPKQAAENGKPAKKSLTPATPKSIDDSDDSDDSDDFDDESDDSDEVDDSRSAESSFDEDDEDEDEDEDESDEEGAPTPVPPRSLQKKADKKKRPAESPVAATPPADKKIKTPSGKPGKPKPDAKSAQKPQTPATSAKKDKKERPDKSTPKTPDTKSKASKTPGTDAKPASGGKLGQYHCMECNRNFGNESGLAQHNTAKHKK